MVVAFVVAIMLMERIVQNAYHFLVVIGEMDIAVSLWNVNAVMVIMETFANMPIVPLDVIHSMVTAYAPTLAGVIQVFYNMLCFLHF